MFRMPHNCLIFCCLSLNFFAVFQDKLQHGLVTSFYLFRHGWYMQSNYGSTAFYVGNK